MDSAKSAVGEGQQRVSVLQVANPTSVIVATSSASSQGDHGGGKLAVTTPTVAVDPGTAAASALIVSQATAGGAPIIVGLIPSDAGGHAAVIGVAQNPATVATTPSMSTGTAVEKSSTNRTAVLSSQSPQISSQLVQVTQIPQIPVGQRTSHASQASKVAQSASSSSKAHSVPAAGHGAGKPKSFAAMMAGDTPATTPHSSSKKQGSSAKKGIYLVML